MLYDTHAHLDYPEFITELPAVLERARAAGITRILAVGTDLDSSRRVLALADQFAPIHAVVGWHPGQVMDAPADFRPDLRELARHPKVVALGETGLDYFRMPSRRDPPGTAADDAEYQRRQAALFQQHLEVAAETGLNCVIHERAAMPDVLALWEPFAGRVRAVFHCFAGDRASLERIVSLNGLVSFTGILTFKNGQNVRDALVAAPADRFMLETDCPFLAPVPHRGKRCEPAFVRETAELAAQLRGMTLEELGAVTCATARGFFRGLP